jgi:hypothetical protein
MVMTMEGSTFISFCIVVTDYENEIWRHYGRMDLPKSALLGLLALLGISANIWQKLIEFERPYGTVTVSWRLTASSSGQASTAFARISPITSKFRGEVSTSPLGYTLLPPSELEEKTKQQGKGDH